MTKTRYVRVLTKMITWTAIDSATNNESNSTIDNSVLVAFKERAWEHYSTSRDSKHLQRAKTSENV